MKVLRSYRYWLAPTPAQDATLREYVGVTRLVYNLCLEQRRDFWRQYRRATGQPLTGAVQSREITVLRAQFDWIGAVPRTALDKAVRDLDRAFAAYFEGRSGFPSPRRRGRNDSFRLGARDVEFRKLNTKWSAVHIPKLGWTKFRDTRPAGEAPATVTVAFQSGRWILSIQSAIELAPAAPMPSAVGIDRGIARTLTLSTGEHVQAPDAGPITAKRKRAQRALARCRKGSARRRAAKARAAALSARAARIRADWSHRTSTDIARRFGLVAIEALKIANMTAAGRGKRGLNRSILEQCWGSFARNLDYKMTERGGVLISVPAAYTSQTCAGCGVVDARSRESQAVFRCVHCGHEDNADVNAANEILRRSTARLGVEGPVADLVKRQPQETAYA